MFRIFFFNSTYWFSIISFFISYSNAYSKAILIDKHDNSPIDAHFIKIGIFKSNQDSDTLKKSSVIKNVFSAEDFAWDGFDFEFSWDEDLSQNISPYSKSDLSGTFTSFYGLPTAEVYSKNGKKMIFAQGNYKNGYKNGHWVYYQCDGSKKFEGSYTNGIRQGKWVNYDHCNLELNTRLNELYYNLLFYFPTDDINLYSEIINYESGVSADTIYYVDEKLNLGFMFCSKNGAWYHGNGSLMKSMLDSNGTCVLYYSNGQICRTENYNTDNMRTGPSKSYYSNGQVQSEGQFQSDIGVGRWIYFDEYGNITHNGDWIEDYGKYGLECNCQ